MEEEDGERGIVMCIVFTGGKKSSLFGTFWEERMNGGLSSLARICVLESKYSDAGVLGSGK